MLVTGVCLLIFGSVEAVLWQHGTHLVLAIVCLGWGISLMLILWKEG